MFFELRQKDFRIFFASVSIFLLFFRQGAPETQLETLRIKYGADMAMVNYDGRTPLHVAGKATI